MLSKMSKVAAMVFVAMLIVAICHVNSILMGPLPPSATKISILMGPLPPGNGKVSILMGPLPPSEHNSRG